MSGYRDELDSALRQLKVAREEASRLRAELDATRAAGGSSLGVALATWSHASWRARAAVVLAPAAMLLAAGGLYLAARWHATREVPPPTAVVEPLVPDARATPICPPPRPCIERHRSPAEPADEGIITEGPWRGYRRVRPARGSEDPGGRDGLITVRTHRPRSCALDGLGFRAPTTLNRRPGEYSVACEVPGGQALRWRAVVVAGMLTQLVETSPAP